MSPSEHSGQAAETIFYGGTILTMDDDLPQVEAVAIADGRILAVGDKAAVMSTASEATELTDLCGAVLMPSFIDAHGHFANAPQLVSWANVSGQPAGPVASIPDVIDVLNHHVARRGIGPGQWIIGYGYDPTLLAEQRQITVDDLDPHFPDNPVMLIHVSNHGAVLNSPAFAQVGINESTETPAGGVILRKEGSQAPAGLIMEAAFLPVFTAMPQPTESALLDAFDEAQQMYARAGTTTAQEGATAARDLGLIRTAAATGLLYLDIVSVPLVTEIPALVKEYFPGFEGTGVELPDDAADSFGTYRDHLKIEGVKLVVDGSPQGKTAWWTEPLLTEGPQGEPNWRGGPVVAPEVIKEIVAELHRKNIQIFAHCNGDAAIDLMIDAVREAGMNAGQDHRTVVVHSQFMRPEQLDAYTELGMTPSFFTVHLFFWGDVHIENTGRKRASFMSPMKAAQDHGLHFSNHNDFSVTPIEPMRMVWSAVTRTSRSGEVIGPDQRVDVLTALRALTIEAAWQIREEDQKGTLTAGKLADLVILDGNPLTVEPDAILDIEVVETFKEGRSVYRQAG